MGILYIVSTPIGNLGDITKRSLAIFEKVKIVVCEDTRKTGLLFKLLDIENKPKFISFYNEVEDMKINMVLDLLMRGNEVILVSDAGTPLISDPGFKLVRECKKNNIEVISLPGPSAVLAALTSSGLPSDKFIFLGYLPKKKNNRKKLLMDIKTWQETYLQLKSTIIFFETPHSLIKTLDELMIIFGDIQIALAKELSKLHEKTTLGKITDLKKDLKVPKGEYVVLFNLGV